MMSKPNLLLFWALLKWSRSKPLETLIILRPEILPETSWFCTVAADQPTHPESGLQYVLTLAHNSHWANASKYSKGTINIGWNFLNISTNETAFEMFMPTQSSILFCKYESTFSCLCWSGAVDWVLACEWKGCPVDSVRAYAWIKGQVPSWGAWERKPNLSHINASCPLFLSPSPSL